MTGRLIFQLPITPASCTSILSRPRALPMCGALSGLLRHATALASRLAFSPFATPLTSSAPRPPRRRLPHTDRVDADAPAEPRGSSGEPITVQAY